MIENSHHFIKFIYIIYKYLPTSDALDEEDVCFLSAVESTGEENILIPILNFENNFSNIFEFSRSAQVLTVQWYLIN